MKRSDSYESNSDHLRVATVLTVYGIETGPVEFVRKNTYVATVLTVYGIETFKIPSPADAVLVATVLTVYGIETSSILRISFSIESCSCNSTYRLRY